MYYQVKNKLSKIQLWKIVIAALSVFSIWQYYNISQAHAGTINSSDVIISDTQSPAANPKQITVDHWKNANYLAVIPTSEKINHTKDDLFCLAKNIYHEAGNQSRLGKFAIAQVTINRMKHPQFNKTVCGVVFEPYQFSWANNRRLRWTTPSENQVWEESKEIAHKALDQGFRVKGMQDAIYYHATYASPNWRHVDRLVRIGAHIFYAAA